MIETTLQPSHAAAGGDEDLARAIVAELAEASARLEPHIWGQLEQRIDHATSVYSLKHLREVQTDLHRFERGDWHGARREKRRAA